jgi:hypothetical protein
MPVIIMIMIMIIMMTKRREAGVAAGVKKEKVLSHLKILWTLLSAISTR